MKRMILAVSLLLAGQASVFAQKSDIVKKGLNVGPLPVVAFDADKGFQLGGIVQLFDYGDGTSYPNYDSKWYLEASFFTKGSMLFQLMYDNKVLIPGVRWASAVSANIDKGMDFFGFNGYGTFYDQERIALGKSGQDYIFTPFYKVNRIQILAKTDFIGRITKHFKWELGYHAAYFKEGDIDYGNINKGKEEKQFFPEDQPTLYAYFRKWGLISDDEAYGGFVSSVRLGLTYDSRNKEGAPSKGIWAEGHLSLAPRWLGSKNEFYRYSFTFRHYLPIVKDDVLTFAYRLNYEGTIGNNAPYYILPYITVMGENCDKDGMGGFRNVRGVLRNRIVGLDMATYTAELRWRFVKFQLWKQNIALGLNLFSDGSMVTRGRDMTFRYDGTAADYADQKRLYDKYVPGGKEVPHVTFGAGFRFIMNENFIVAAEYGMPLTHFLKNSPHYNQDGTGAFYLNVGYLF
ncbi:MAG: outer membrane protein assembly factor [Bacteroidales bacterium]|nr:outer membrane protein assembly factor [Bacteroidales bacterium]